MWMLTYHIANYLILLHLSEIQSFFCHFRDVAKVMIMQKKIYPNFATHQIWKDENSFYIPGY
jgi:hypothetical protein